MFQFRPFPTYAYFIQRTLTRSSRAGFPHSEISGSKPICGSPKLIAACHVLRRLLMPRHPPCALCRLTSSSLFREVVSGSQVIFENYASSINSCCFEIDALPDQTSMFSTFLFSHATFSSFCRFRLFLLIRCSVLKVLSPRAPLWVASGLRFLGDEKFTGGPEWARTTDLTIISRTL